MADETQHSNDLTVAQAASRIGGLDSAEAIQGFVAGDDRQGVQRAAESRIAALVSAGEIAAGEVASADPRAKPGKPLEAGGTGTKLVRTRFPVDRFEHGIDGVEPITARGVEVAANKVEELLEVARAHDTRLEEVEA